jgi:tripartite-type tricarboxylate transporter receptor subunit TctC
VSSLVARQADQKIDIQEVSMFDSLRILFAVLWFLDPVGRFNKQSLAGQDSALPSTINLVIPYIPGTGADIQTRVVARFLPKYLPGAPTFVVKNDAGAGGRAGVQTVYRSKPDGAAVGGAYTPDALANEALYGIDGAGFDFSKFVPLMSTYHQPYTVSVGPKASYKSLDEMKRSAKPVPFCTTTGMDMSYIVIATKAIGIPMRLIPGFKGAPTAMAGLLRGDCEAVSLGIEFTTAILRTGFAR